MSPKQTSADRAQLLFFGVLILCLASVGGQIAIRIALSRTLERKLAQTARGGREAHEQAVKDSEAKFQAALVEAEAAVPEGRAEQARAQEFERRQAMDAAFAKSPLEKRLKEMAQLGQDSSLDPAARLQKLAKLASPKGSGVRVSRAKKAYAVEVAVPLPAIQIEDHGGKTDTADRHRETQRAAAGIMRDLFAFGAASGLQSVEVSCQQVVEVRGGGSLDSDRREYLELYRAKLEPRSAPSEGWGRTSRTEALRLMRVMHDEFGRVVARP
jgi:hypothetical protein